MRQSEADGPLLIFAGEDGDLVCWAHAGAEVSFADEPTAALPATKPVALVVPGSAVAIHWLDLPEGLTRAQAVAAARLQLGPLVAEPLADLHVAVGGQERGLTCVAVLRTRLMEAWLSAARGLGVDPHVAVPGPLLLQLPPAGLTRFQGRRGVDFRGEAEAFSMEPDLSSSVAGERQIAGIEREDWLTYASASVSSPFLNLRQGVFARRRRFRLQPERLRRSGLLLVALALLSFLVPLTTAIRYSIAADRLEAEAAELAAASGRSAAAARAVPFSTISVMLIDAVRSTADVELSELRYEPDGALHAQLVATSPVSIEALQQRLKASGLEATSRGVAGERTAALTVRAR